MFLIVETEDDVTETVVGPIPNIEGAVKGLTHIALVANRGLSAKDFKAIDERHSIKVGTKVLSVIPSPNVG